MPAAHVPASRVFAPRLLLVCALSVAALIGAGPAVAVPSPAVPTDATQTHRASAARPTDHLAADSLGSTVAAHEAADGAATAPGIAAAAASGRPLGLDVSSYQGNVDWAGVAARGGRFAYVKATESTTYRNPFFGQQYVGSYRAGLIRGAYHFALPDRSSGVTQADFFAQNGGAWSPDGKTLPPMLDIEYNPYGVTCYGLSQPAMVAWIQAFGNELHARTGRYPTIYTTTNWWSTCTGNNGGFARSSPLFIARYAANAGILPAGWAYYTFWQYASSGSFPGDQDLFNGSLAQLRRLARG